MKKCFKCGKEKKLKFFYAHPKTKDKHLNKCKECTKNDTKLINNKVGIWRDMMRRCYDKRRKEYSRYNGRGITVCKRWHIFENFYKDMGERPKGLTLDRIDNNKGYYKENCRWATYEQQANNTSGNRILEYNGEKMTVAQASRKFNIPYKTLYSRLYKGWSIEKSINF